jgi:O-antigen ligase
MISIPKTLQSYWRLFQASIISLPYLYYPSIVGLGLTPLLVLARFRQVALDRLTRNTLLVITGLLLLSSLFAFDRGEAFLQLTNFLPFFLLFAVLPLLLKGTERLERLAMDLVIATIPINLLAFVEYVLRSNFIPKAMRRLPLTHWYRSRPHMGRAMVMFGHPNALASYLVLIFGLGLGLILCHAIRKQFEGGGGKTTFRTWLLYGGTFLNLLGIFSSGSRNGLLVAVSQLILFSLFTKASRAILLAGTSLLGVVVGAAWLGVGGRSLFQSAWEDDPRIAVWKFALGLIQERPWLGWGLGNFKFQYPPELIPGYKYIAHPHNFWLLLASEAGIPVMILFTLLVGYICYRSVRLLLSGQLKPLDNAVLLAYLFAFWGCVSFALFDVTFYDIRLNALNWVVLAGIYSIAKLATLPQLELDAEDRLDRG